MGMGEWRVESGVWDGRYGGRWDLGQRGGLEVRADDPEWRFGLLLVDVGVVMGLGEGGMLGVLMVEVGGVHSVSMLCC